MPALYIEKKILMNNIRITRGLAKDSLIIGVIKGKGYGMGLVPYARLLTECGIEMLAVTELSDAVTLRNAGIHCDILMLSPLYDREDIAVALSHYIILCISSFQCGELAEQVAAELGIYGRGHICIDTGLGRYGFLHTHAKDVAYTIQCMRHICVTGIFSHFYGAACRNASYTKQQFEQFTSLCHILEQENIYIGFRHIAASCALLRFPETRLEAVRIGSAFLGRLPFPDKWGYEPVGFLEAPVDEICTLPAGHNIGYGHTYITRKKTKIAVIAAGYSHGLGIKRDYGILHPSHLPHAVLHLVKKALLPEKIYAYHGEERFPVLGKVGMTSLVIDITEASSLCAGDILRFPINPLYVDSSIPRLIKPA